MNKYKTLEEFFADLTEPRLHEVRTLQAIILSIKPEISEHIKWNAPSYVYKRIDRITFNMHDKNRVRLVLHCDTAIKEDKKGMPVLDNTSGMLVWSSNIRATISFNNADDITAKEAQLRKILAQWLDVTLV